MNYSPPENNNFGNNQNWNFGPKPPHFVPVEIWNREKHHIKSISTLAAASILLFILLSSVFSNAVQILFALISSSISTADYELFASKWNSAQFQYVFEIIYSVFIVGAPFFAIGYLSKKKGYLGSIPTGKPLDSKLLPVIIIGAFGVCLFGNIITTYFDAIVQAVFGFRLQMPEMPETPRNAAGILLFYLSTAVVPALVEEMALRGIIMQQLRRYGDMFAIVCSALIFGLMHCNLLQIPFAVIAGVAIGYAVVVTDSLWTGVIIHFLNNAFSVTVSLIDDFYGMESTAYIVCNAIFYAVIALGGLFTFIYLKKFNKPLKKSSLVNQSKDFYGTVPPFSAKISYGTIYKAFLLTVPMILAFIAVVYETIIITLTYAK